MELPSPNTEIDAASWDEVTKEESPALDSNTEQPSSDGGDFNDQAEGLEPAASDAPAPPDTAANNPAPADPYAGLPESVRNALATIPALQQELRSTVGRVGALQRELAHVRQAPAPAPEAPPAPSKLDALRLELPEVAEALEEATRNRGPGPEELRAELAAQMQEEFLETQRPSWAQELTGNDFQSWLTTQPPSFQEELRNSSRASVVLNALKKFDGFKEQATQRTQQLQRNQSRLSAAVTPSSGARRTPGKSVDDMSEAELWDHLTR
jgi:hypothetical protein